MARSEAGEDDAAIATMVDRQWAEILALDDPKLRTLTLIQYATHFSELVGADHFVELFSLVAADDPLWSARVDLVVELLGVMGERQVARDYVEQLLNSQADPAVLAAVRQAQLIALDNAGYGPMSTLHPQVAWNRWFSS